MNIFKLLENALKEEKSFLDDEGKLLKSKIQTSALNMDPVLLNILIKNPDLKSAFFKEVAGIYIFDKVSFSWILNSSEFLPNSFTQFKNKIGLIDSTKHYISRTNDVVLAFPFKDCVLEFDSTTESETRDEIMLNEILCEKDIDYLFANKALGNSTKVDKTGSNMISTYSGENLIIKGNNLIAMHSLLPKYAGKIKMMYWDVLYNTNSDLVPYNDSFKHSTWLTMMKNRLEVAYDLLSDDGTIVIQLDYNEFAYLKVLMDEIFKDGYVSMITVKTSSESGVKVNANKPIKTSEYLLMYCKNKDCFNYVHPRIKLDDYEKNYSYYVENPNDDPKNWIICNFKEKAAQLYNCKKSELKNEQLLQFQIDYCNNVFSVRDISDALKKFIKDNEIDKNSVYTYVTSTGKKTLLYKNGEIVFVKNKVIVENGKPCLSKMASDIWVDIPWDGIAGEGNAVLKNGKKPEKLLCRLLNSLTNENDIVLDAYFGTGTTGAVALKMNRKFIGIEQLESHYVKAVERLTGVVNGDQTGISKEVNWNGGGEFIYCEILKDNQRFIDEVIKANKEELLLLYKQLIKSPFILNYNINLDILIDKNSIEQFESLDVDIQKKVLITLLDKNSLYINYENINDLEYEVSKPNMLFSNSFYED